VVIDRKKRGFERLTPEQRVEMARQAGRRSQALGRAHQWTKDEARAAGLKAAENRRQRKVTP
jgi:hypothetical protein